MKKTIISFLLVTILVGIGLLAKFIYFSDETGQVLGSSVNYYKEKVVVPQKPPVMKAGAKEPQILAESAVLILNSNKYVLYDKNSGTRVPIASITKIMTALVSAGLFGEDEVVEIKPEYLNVEGSKINLLSGEKITYGNLLYGLLVNSGNDAAKAIANAKTTEDEFISLMNQKAEEIGLVDTRFKDPAGLNDSGFSTAREVTILFSQAIKNEGILKRIKTGKIEIKSVDEQISHPLENSNRLVNGEIELAGVIGGKTGFTYSAGHTLVCAATRNEITLVSVVLKTKYDTKAASAVETQKLLEWGFNSFVF
ncbi:MAG: hypothetical protein OEV37_01230 [Candidatus Berkelbacteria bacterium]|nr:hypothetical protein [Candidatus Berkelbacteria bacterium]